MDNNNNNYNGNQPPNQGQDQYQYQGQGYVPPRDGKSMGISVLSFFFPLVGLILWLVWRDEKPLKARSAGIGAIVGVAASIVLYIMSAALGLFAAFMI